MDVKRVDSIAVPTALAAVGGGVVGYMIPKMTKNGEITDEFVRYSADAHKIRSEKFIQKANSLDKIKFVPSKEEVEKLYGKKNRRQRTLDLFKETSKKGNRQLENFVMKNAEAFDIKPAKGQSLRDAAKEFIKGKTIEEIKEAFFPKAQADTIKNTNYKQLIKEYFEVVYDKDANSFKKNASIDAIKMFKRDARNMKLKSAAKWGAITGAIALISSISATIANRISNR